VNINWLAAFLTNPKNFWVSGILYDNLDDAMFFAGIEEAAHYQYYAHRQDDIPQTEQTIKPSDNGDPE